MAGETSNNEETQSQNTSKGNLLDRVYHSAERDLNSDSPTLQARGAVIRTAFRGVYSGILSLFVSGLAYGVSVLGSIPLTSTVQGAATLGIGAWVLLFKAVYTDWLPQKKEE